MAARIRVDAPPIRPSNEQRFLSQSSSHRSLSTKPQRRSLCYLWYRFDERCFDFSRVVQPAAVNESMTGQLINQIWLYQHPNKRAKDTSFVTGCCLARATTISATPPVGSQRDELTHLHVQQDRFILAAVARPLLLLALKEHQPNYSTPGRSLCGHKNVVARSFFPSQAGKATPYNKKVSIS